MAKQLSRRMVLLLSEGVYRAGSYDPEEALISVEERMTVAEYREAEAFLGWCHSSNKRFGHGNIQKVYKEWGGRK